MDRKIVKPTHKDGKIWNPEHGRFLPAEGLEVEMTPYWLNLVERQDVVASDLPPEPEVKTAAATPAKPASPAPAAAVPAATAAAAAPKPPVKAAPTA